MMNFLYSFVIRFFSNNKNSITNTSEQFYNFISKVGVEIGLNLQKRDIIYFNEINTYGVFKYDAVKEVMMSNAFGVSPVHLELNHIYFQKDEKRHQHNKKVAIKYLSFLSKELQFQHSEYTTHLLQKLIQNCPKNKSFDFIEYLINPLVFISALNDLGFLKMLNQLDFEDPDFKIDNALDEINKIFERREYLEALIESKIKDSDLPATMQRILDEASVEEPYHKDDLPKFFTSMIFANAETVASFMSSYIYFVFKQYPELIDTNDWKKLQELANEIVRIYVPTPTAYRTVCSDVEFRGVKLKQGDLIALFINAANTDPLVFEDPYTIKFDRIEKHLSFGRGKLACIGQFASFRITLNVLKELIPYKDTIEFLEDEPTFKKSGVLKINCLNTILHV